MAKRRSKTQIDADQIVKKQLNELGERIYLDAVATSRRDTGVLQDTQNYRVKPDTTLTMAQVYYGKFNYPAGVTSGDKNALMLAVLKHLPAATKIIVTEITDELLQNYK